MGIKIDDVKDGLFYKDHDGDYCYIYRTDSEGINFFYTESEERTLAAIKKFKDGADVDDLRETDGVNDTDYFDWEYTEDKCSQWAVLEVARTNWKEALE